MNKTLTEIDKKFSAIMLRWIESQWKIEKAHQNGEPYTRMKFEADSAKIEKELKDLFEEAKKEGAREVAMDIIRMCEMTDDEMTRIEEKYGFKLSDIKLPDYPKPISNS